MNIAIAAIATVGVLYGGFLYMGNLELSDQVDSLRTELDSAQADLAKARASENKDKFQDDEIKALQKDLAGIRDAGEKASSAGAAVDLSGLEAQLAAHDKEIAQLKKDLKGSSQVSSAFDQAADRFLGGRGTGANGERESGLNRLSELRTLFSGDAGELTPEQQKRREELTKQFQGQRDDWTIRGFDRTLELKLDDGQKDTMKQFLAQERTSLDELRGQELEKEALAASQKQLKADTDARIETILTADQNASWGEYRTRSSRSRSFGRSSRGRSSRDRGTEQQQQSDIGQRWIADQVVAIEKAGESVPKYDRDRTPRDSGSKEQREHGQHHQHPDHQSRRVPVLQGIGQNSERKIEPWIRKNTLAAEKFRAVRHQVSEMQCQIEPERDAE